MNAFEITNTTTSNFMTEARATTQNQLGEHRFVPYHFKGLRQDQID